MNKAALLSGSTIGILGGGQLGQMLSMAASRLGFKTHVFEPSANPPASNVSYRFTQAEYDDYDALEKFASNVDVVTYEFENIPLVHWILLKKIVKFFQIEKLLKYHKTDFWKKSLLIS